MLEINNWAIGHTTASFKTKPETLEHWIELRRSKCERYPWLVAELDGSVVGYAMASPFMGRCGLDFTTEVSVYVAPDHQRRGVGGILYKKLVPVLQAQGFHALIAVITVPNEASERLHKSCGFRKIGTLARVGWKFGQWHDIALWELTLMDDGIAPVPLRTAADVMPRIKEKR